jgi:hypothetical protein
VPAAATARERIGLLKRRFQALEELLGDDGGAIGVLDG